MASRLHRHSLFFFQQGHEVGSYLDSKSEATLIDHLNPRSLARIIRIDPCHQPYEYKGSHSGFVLRSAGPDGKANTLDDMTETH